MNKILRRTLSGMAVGVALCGAAEASSVSYLLNQSNALPDGNYLRVTIDDDGAIGNINFTVTPLSALTASSNSSSNFGIQKFGFNEVGLTSANILFTGTGSSAWTTKPTGGNVSEFGNFSYLISGKGSNRANPLTFSITNVAGDTISSYASIGIPLFAAHVAGFSIGCGSGNVDEDNHVSSGNSVQSSSKHRNDVSNAGSGSTNECSPITSAYFAGSTQIVPPENVVPVPASGWLLFSGLVGLVGISRRNKLNP